MMNTHRAWERVAIRRTWLAVLLAGIAGLAFVLVLALPQNAAANHTPTATLVAVDTDVSGNTFNAIGNIDPNGAAVEDESVTVDIVIDGSTDLLAFSLELAFDEKILEFTGVTAEFSVLSKGPVPGITPPLAFNQLIVSQIGIPAAGALELVVAMQAGGTALTGDGTSGLDGYLVRLTFDAVGPGMSPLTLSAVVLAAGTGTTLETYAPAMTTSGSVDVSSPDVAPFAKADPDPGDPALTTVPGGMIANIPVTDNDTQGTQPIQLNTVLVIQDPPSGQGTVTNNADGTLTYNAPATGFEGTTTFTYTVEGTGGLKSNEAVVTVTVDGNPPTIVAPLGITVVEPILDMDAPQDTQDFSGRSIADFLGEATASDPEDGDISGSVVSTVLAGTPPDPFVVGDTTVNFDVMDSAGNPAATATATVTVLAFGVDTDGDGTDNGDEVFNGTDPNDPNSCPIDLNDMGGVDILDVILMINATDLPYDARFDLNRDGMFVDFLDLIVLLNAFGDSCEAAP